MNHVRDASWMQERGHDVIILCIENSPMHERAIEWNIPVLFIKEHKKYYDFSRAKELVRILRSNSVSHLIVRSTSDISIAATAKSKLGQKLHTTYILGMQLGVKKKNLLHTIRYRYIDLWVCPLPYLKRQVEEWTNYKNKLVVIPSGIDLSEFDTDQSSSYCREQLSLPTDILLFGIIGRIDPQKGQLLLLNSMTLCRNKDFSVVFMGDLTLNEGNQALNDIQSFISDHQLEHRVYLRPYQKDTSVFYKAIDWMVMASKAETFGMVTIEAIASGCPVLGSNKGGTPDIINTDSGIGGLLFESQDPVDLARRIDEIIDQKITFDAKELKAMASVYDFNRICYQIEEVLEIDHPSQ